VTRNIANAAAKAHARTLRIKPLLRCNLLTYFKNFLGNLRPSIPVGTRARSSSYFRDLEIVSISARRIFLSKRQLSGSTGFLDCRPRALRYTTFRTVYIRETGW